ncbi:putative membrane protein [Escherichia coli DEC10B]|nr:putative membrane protein [Escherichia coli DEC8C]EHW71542.1 putative membrane protein [Escherichia coli DEC10B]
MTVKLRLAVAALLLFLVVMVDFTSRIMSVLADGVLVCGIVVLLWPVIKETACIMLDFLFTVY